MRLPKTPSRSEGTTGKETCHDGSPNFINVRWGGMVVVVVVVEGKSGSLGRSRMSGTRGTIEKKVISGNDLDGRKSRR
jgi:hypothetical protein